MTMTITTTTIMTSNTVVRTKREIYKRETRTCTYTRACQNGKNREDDEDGGAAIVGANIVRKKRARCNHVPIRFHI